MPAYQGPTGGEEEESNKVHLIKEDSGASQERRLVDRSDPDLSFLVDIGGMDEAELVGSDLRP